MGRAANLYDNTNTSVTSVIKSAFEIRPSLENIRVGFQSTELTYDPTVVLHAWQKLYKAASSEPNLWTNPAYQHDMVDVTRQVMANAFIPLYQSLISSWNTSDADSLSKTGKIVIDFLGDLNNVLLTNSNFRLSLGIKSARS
ncbi:hypothetical protein PENSUB_8315 [Penicillium subrubescens]|jgi:alpha-N-acetylglucosaminidase|uniref:Alpha-N-acetylglucosaminidase C-terminal domain-containing protein n=1 Tax=Penicillium subrubescens TaxID=1316194 RepID=A0A1Q5THH9_9EURO|nr:hypothetical protein PENSUB_8315 [Penicillium subrubescens]